MPETGLEPALLAEYAPETYVSTNSTTRAERTNTLLLNVSTTRLELARLAAPPPQSGVSTNSTTWTYLLFRFAKLQLLFHITKTFFILFCYIKYFILYFKIIYFWEAKYFSFYNKQNHIKMTIFSEENTIFEGKFDRFLSFPLEINIS